MVGPFPQGAKPMVNRSRLAAVVLLLVALGSASGHWFRHRQASSAYYMVPVIEAPPAVCIPPPLVGQPPVAAVPSAMPLVSPTPMLSPVTPAPPSTTPAAPPAAATPPTTTPTGP